MQEISIFKELTAIETFDGVIYTTVGLVEIDKIISDKKFIQIGQDRIAVHQIKRYGPKKLDTIESYILSKPKDIQDILRTRQSEKKARIGKGFESIEEINNYLNKKINTKGDN